MRRAKVVPGKHVMAAFMVALKEAIIKAEAIKVHINHKHTAIKELKDKGESPTVTVMVHTVYINKTTTLPLHTHKD